MMQRHHISHLYGLGYSTVVRQRDCARGRSVAVLQKDGAVYVSHGVRIGRKMQYSMPWRFASLVEITVTLTQMFTDAESIGPVRLTMAETIRRARNARRS